MLRVRGIGRAGGEQIHGSRVADQARQEERRHRLHGDPAPGEHKAVLAALVGDADGAGQRERHPYADG